MKNSTFLLMLLFLASLLNQQSFAQNREAATYFAKMITAQKYMTGDGLPMDTAQAFRLYKDCAENGKMTSAMNQLGTMYEYGFGTSKDLSKAFFWFSKSADKGDPTGMYQLGTMYKNGEAVPQNFAKAYACFKASAEKGFPGGMYGAGYCSMKGLGTAQDYGEAVKWFKEGVLRHNNTCTFMLGVCYRNGFGVEQNKQEAEKLLLQVAGKKLDINDTGTEKRKTYLLESNSIDETGKTSNDKSSKKEKFRQLVKHEENISLGGNWSGTRYLYDWSGQHITHQAELSVSIEQSGNQISGKWVEGGKPVVKFKGVIVDGQIVFNGSSFKTKDDKGQSKPIEFKYARFEAINADVNYLAGNIESYYPQAKEPGRPCYVVMSKLQEKKATIDTLKAIMPELAKIADSSSTNTLSEEEAQPEEETTLAPAPDTRLKSVGTMQNEALDYFREKDAVMTVFPNPFKNEINISYRVNEESETRVLVYSATGSLVLQKSLGVKTPGKHLEKLQFETIPGQYVLRLVIGNEAYAKIIIKQ